MKYIQNFHYLPNEYYSLSNKKEIKKRFSLEFHFF